MEVIELTESRRNGHKPMATTSRPTQTSTTIEGMRSEIDEYLEEMRSFGFLQPDDVFLKLSAWSARAREMQIQSARTDNQRSKAFKSREVEPFIDECKFQFSLFSRFAAMRQLDWDMQRGV